MRAKPKSFDPLFWPPPQSVIWRTRDEELLTDDLDLDVRRDKATCRKMIDALSAEVESYRQGLSVNTARPTPAHKLAELNALGPTIEKAYHGLRDLSFLARKTLTDAPLLMGTRALSDEEMDRATIASARYARAINCAQNDLCDLSIAITQAIHTLSTERRGRKPNPVHLLILRLAGIFKRYDRGEHEDVAARRSACEAFVRHALKAAQIHAPQRLTPYLPQQ